MKVLPEVVDIPCGGGNGIRFYDRIEVGPIGKDFAIDKDKLVKNEFMSLIGQKQSH